MGEDEDAAGARRLDEAERGDGLAGARGVLEPEALAGVGILGRLRELAPRRGRRLLPSPAAPRRPSSSSSSSSPGMAAERELDRRARRAAAFRWPFAGPAGALRLGEQRGQRARQRVDLVGGEDGAVDQRRLLDAEQALEPEQQRPLAAPRERRGGLRRRRARRAPRRTPAGAGTAAPSAVATASPSSTKGSRVNLRTRSRSRTTEDVACRPLLWGQPMTARRSDVGDAAGNERRPRLRVTRDIEKPAAPAACSTPIEADRPALPCKSRCAVPSPVLPRASSPSSRSS